MTRRLTERIPVLAVAVTLFMAAALLPGCNTQGCTDNHSALPLMGFYDSRTGQAMSLDSLAIGGVGAPGDSLLVAPGTAVRQVYLPFRFDRDEVAFFIHYASPEQGLDDPALNDTVTFRYSSEPFFASEECGAMFRYKISSVSTTHHLIDSVAVTDSVVTNVERERFQIFVRTAGEEQAAALSLRRGSGL